MTKFSAIAVASDTSCGGCDNDTTSSTNIAGAKTAIAAFFDAGGGIVAMAGADNTSYYNFLPASATNPGTVTCSSCFTQTAAGAAAGLPAVNGDFPHNFFPFPGSGGESAAYQVFETYTGPSSAGNLTNQPFGLFFEGKSTTLTGAAVPTLGIPGMILLLIGVAGASLFILRRHA